MQSRTEEEVKLKSDLRHTLSALARAEGREDDARNSLRVAELKLREVRDGLQAIQNDLLALQQIIKLATKFLGTKMISSTNIHNCGRNLKFVCKNEAPYFLASRLEF